MTPAQNKAWNCLKQIEQQSLFLQLSNGKSAWESGNILNLSHYKYLEIRERSMKFFKMFTEFFEKHPSLFNPQGPCEELFVNYMTGIIEYRLSRKEASGFTGDSSSLINSYRSRVIIRNMQRLKDSEDGWDKDTLRLIFEFDRWNNFRILPKMWQQPSAYKRRINKTEKIYINYLLYKFPEWLHEKILEKFKYHNTGNNKKVERYYITLISRKLYDNGYYTFQIKASLETVKELTKFYLYVFKDKIDAEQFGYMVANYNSKTSSVKLGQKFWPEYRQVVRESVNYLQVNNLEFGVKSIDMAYGISRNSSKRVNKRKPTGVKRADPLLFEKI